jgi:hypothetical protein
MPPETSGPEMSDLRARRLGRVAVIAGIRLVVLIVLAIGIWVGVFVMLFPGWDNHANATLSALVMV